MRKLTQEEYCGNQGDVCKGWSCEHFRLESFISAKYCVLDVCNFKKKTGERCQNPPDLRGHFATSSSQRFGKAWHGAHGEE